MEQENEKRCQPINNFYGKINNYTVYEGPVTNTYEGPVNNYAGVAEEEKKVCDIPSPEQIAEKLQKVRAMFWGTSAIATIFCVCRDRYNPNLNFSEFERQMESVNVHCPEGTIRNAIKNSPYMRLPITKWKANGAMERVLVLAREFESLLDQDE